MRVDGWSKWNFKDFNQVITVKCSIIPTSELLTLSRCYLVLDR